MASLLFQGAFATGLEENEAQTTIEPIRDDPQGAEQSAPPEWNAIDSDDSGELVGLSPRVQGSATEPSGRDAQAPPTGVVMDTYTTARDGNQGIDDQVASSGTAAAREAAGQFGHGSIETVIGIEPLNPAQEYGNDYFALPDPGANYAGGNYMTPPEADNWPQAVAQANANKQSRLNVQRSQYASFFGD